MFTYSNGSAAAYITLTCVNAVGGGAPYWDPPYDGDVTPFPPCQKQREYWIEAVAYRVKILLHH